MLTPDERRGALLVLALFLLGAVWDLGAGRQAAPPAHPPADAAGDVARYRSAPVSDSAAARVAVPPAAAAGTGVVDLNRAGAVELDALPGIGPVLARRILEHRAAHGPFRSVEELRAVRGIGPSLMSRLAGRVRAGPRP